jgi:uncharacterized protein (DUF1697 family)
VGAEAGVVATAPITHVALIRGINVGGNNIVKMADLRERLDAAGVGPSLTYIQSGNVLLRAPGRTEEQVEDVVERVLAEGFGVHTVVVVVTPATLAGAVAAAPPGFAVNTGEYRDDVIFLRRALSVDAAMEVVRLREGVDEVAAGPGVLYFRRSVAQATRSLMGKIVGTPPYAHMTIRNWRTTTTLLRMCQEASA